MVLYIPSENYCNFFLVKGESKYIRKVNLGKHCCWLTTFKRDHGKASGLILLYQTGALEIR